MNRMNRLDEMFWLLRKDMKEKRITNKLLVSELKMAPSTVSETINNKRLLKETITRICDFVRDYEPVPVEPKVRIRKKK